MFQFHYVTKAFCYVLLSKYKAYLAINQTTQTTQLNEAFFTRDGVSKIRKARSREKSPSREEVINYYTNYSRDSLAQYANVIETEALGANQALFLNRKYCKRPG